MIVRVASCSGLRTSRRASDGLCPGSAHLVLSTTGNKSLPITDGLWQNLEIPRTKTGSDSDEAESQQPMDINLIMSVNVLYLCQFCGTRPESRYVHSQYSIIHTSQIHHSILGFWACLRSFHCVFVQFGVVSSIPHSSDPSPSPRHHAFA